MINKVIALQHGHLSFLGMDSWILTQYLKQSSPDAAQDPARRKSVLTAGWGNCDLAGMLGKAVTPAVRALRHRTNSPTEMGSGWGRISPVYTPPRASPRSYSIHCLFLTEKGEVDNRNRLGIWAFWALSTASEHSHHNLSPQRRTVTGLGKGSNLALEQSTQ